MELQCAVPAQPAPLPVQRVLRARCRGFGTRCLRSWRPFYCGLPGSIRSGPIPSFRHHAFSWLRHPTTATAYGLPLALRRRSGRPCSRNAAARSARVAGQRVPAVRVQHGQRVQPLAVPGPELPRGVDHPQRVRTFRCAAASTPRSGAPGARPLGAVRSPPGPPRNPAVHATRRRVPPARKRCTHLCPVFRLIPYGRHRPVAWRRPPPASPRRISGAVPPARCPSTASWKCYRSDRIDVLPISSDHTGLAQADTRRGPSEARSKQRLSRSPNWAK